MKRKVSSFKKMFVYLIFLFFSIVHAQHYEDEYNEGSDGDTWEEQLVRVSPNGEIFRFQFEPVQITKGCEKPISRIPSKKIHHADVSNPGDVPYMIAVKKSDDVKKVVCGASIISDKMALSAASCFHTPDGLIELGILQKNYSFVAGEFDTRIDENHEQVMQLEKIIVHDLYSIASGNHDIAILVFTGKLTFTEFVKPIPVAKPGYAGVMGEDEVTATVAGWGYVKKIKQGEEFDESFFPHRLLTATVSTFTRQDCVKMYSSSSEHTKLATYVKNYHFCAGDKNVTVDPCKGDVGGPLACSAFNKEAGANQNVLCGIIVSGIGCGVKGIPGLYLDVTQYTGWIKAYSGIEILE